jgi:hypothetical protein
LFLITEIVGITQKLYGFALLADVRSKQTQGHAMQTAVFGKESTGFIFMTLRAGKPDRCKMTDLFYAQRIDLPDRG